MRASRFFALLTLGAALLAGCQAPSGSSERGAAQPGTASSGPKRIITAVQDDIPMVYQKLNPSSRYRGVDGVQDLVAAGMTHLTADGTSGVELAEAVPSVENGLWKVAPDGTMEITWRIKDGAAWHDGTPFTSADLDFTLQVVRDPDLAIFRDQAFAFIRDVRTDDPRSVTVTWSQPYIHADWLFTDQLALPMPKHLLEQAYQERKAGFIDETYWGSDYVGTGPFKIKEWVLGSHIVLVANESFVLGRPKVDEVQVRFISDDETLAANLLAGSVDVVLGRSISGPQASQVRDSSQGQVRMEPSYSTWVALYPQLIDPNPAVMLNLQFRQAILYGTNRQELSDTLLPGQSSVADSWLLPGQPQYKDIEAKNVTHFPYDARKAADLITGLGYAKGADGMYADSAGNRLTIDIRTTAGDDLREKMQLAILDYWKQIGLDGTPTVVPRQQAQDLPYRATFPGFELNRNPPDERGLVNLQSKTIPLPENEFRVTGNRSRYKNAEMDALVDKYFVTIPAQERMQVMGQIVKKFSDELPVLAVFYDAIPTLFNSRLVNVGASIPNGTQAWNSYAWDVKS